MAPTKFEDRMRDTLEKRSITPSPEAWSKLEARLDNNKASGRATLYWWLGMAACVLIIITISVNKFSSTDTEEILPVIVDTKSNDLDDKQEINPTQKKEDIQVVSNDLTKESIQNKNNTKRAETAKQSDIKSSATKSQNLNVKVAEANEKQIIKSTNYLKDKVEELTVEVDLDATASILKDVQLRDTVSKDKEVDSLLKAAQKELLLDKTFKENLRTVDASSLLRDVEEELEQSFRSKVLEALVSSYETVKTAVANRNN